MSSKVLRLVIISTLYFHACFSLQSIFMVTPELTAAELSSAEATAVLSKRHIRSTDPANEDVGPWLRLDIEHLIFLFF